MSDPVFHRGHPAHYANLMINYMIAKELQRLNPGLRLSNFDMPYWNISLPTIDRTDKDVVIRLDQEQHIDFRTIEYGLRTNMFTRIEWHGYGQRLEYFPSLSMARELFARDDVKPVHVDAGHLLCPIRAHEILAGIHPGYTIIPIDFYSDIIEKTGLTPVFMGQTGENAYVNALRDRFPKSEFLPHISAIDDFQTIRLATNILIPVSTFAWLAAWLSKADCIIYPAFGILNPQVFRLHNLIPANDARYQIWLFPPAPAVPEDKLFETHAAIRGQWKTVTSKEIFQRCLE